VLTEVPIEVVREVVKEVPVEVVREVEVPVESVREVEVVREVVKEVPVEVVREVVKEIVRDVPVEVEREVEVVREVPVEVLREVIKEVPVPVEVVRETTQADEEEMRRLRRRLEELQTSFDQLATTGGRVPVDEKMQALLNMAGGVGHVFNNVLAGILGRTQLLLKRAGREKSKELLNGLNEIEAATRQGIDALTRIQEFSRARPAEAFGPVDLNDIVQRAVEQTRPKWRDEPAAKGIRVELITHFGPHSRLIGAESELLEAVVQLVNNAVEAMPRGGTLTIRTGLDSGRGVISVSDTGAGMPESARRRVFEPFFSTKGETGLGLGLSMVYGVMTRHGGDAMVESEEGTGTTITLRVPTSGEGAPVQVTIPEAERQQVLLVDDDETVRTALGDMLRGASYAVSLAASGLEGIARVRERQGAFDLVVTDLGMPDVPGWEVVEAVKQVDATTPVVIMSGFDRARATRRAKELGVDYVISKPFDIHDFLNTVKGLLLGRKRP
jgi:signal transduction histidine kinase/CheY-like chemotaxis protein